MAAPPKDSRNRTTEGLGRELARGGDAVVDTEHGPTFVPGVLPGERVLLRGVRREGGASRADLVRVLEPSPLRVAPACSIAAQCGGCPWMIATPGLQYEWKRHFVAQAVQLPAAQIDFVPSPSPLQYRRRARLGWHTSRTRVTIGYRKPRSREIVDVETCPILVRALDDALRELRRELGLALRGEGEIMLALGADGRAVASLQSDAPQPADVYKHAEALTSTPFFAGISVRFGGASKPAEFGDAREQAIASDGAVLVGTIGGFSQAQEEINDALVRRVIDYAEPSGMSVLELYSGHGNITVALAATAKHVHAVEQSDDAVVAAEKNLRARNFSNVRVAHGDSAEHAKGPHVDVVVLDPPRTGAKDALAALAARKPTRIVYVSCDTATLARDIKTLEGFGFRPTKASAFDMFPQTSHVESVVLLAATNAG